MVEKIPEIKKDFTEQRPVFESLCKECGGAFSVFITPNTADEKIALEELKKIKEHGLCPNCRK